MAASSQDGVDVVGAADGAHEGLVDPLEPPFQPLGFGGRLGQRHLGGPRFIWSHDVTVDAAAGSKRADRGWETIRYRQTRFQQNRAKAFPTEQYRTDSARQKAQAQTQLRQSVGNDTGQKRFQQNRTERPRHAKRRSRHRHNSEPYDNTILPESRTANLEVRIRCSVVTSGTS